MSRALTVASDVPREVAEMADCLRERRNTVTRATRAAAKLLPMATALEAQRAVVLEAAGGLAEKLGPAAATIPAVAPPGGWVSLGADIWHEGRRLLSDALGVVLTLAAVDSTTLLGPDARLVLAVARVTDPDGWHRVEATIKTLLATEANRAAAPWVEPSEGAAILTLADVHRAAARAVQELAADTAEAVRLNRGEEEAPGPSLGLCHS
jgi:hypothetical protein